MQLLTLPRTPKDHSMCLIQFLFPLYSTVSRLDKYSCGFIFFLNSWYVYIIKKLQTPQLFPIHCPYRSTRLNMYKCTGQRLASLLTGASCWRQEHSLCNWKDVSLAVTDFGSWKIVKRVKTRKHRERIELLKNGI